MRMRWMMRRLVGLLGIGCVLMGMGCTSATLTASLRESEHPQAAHRAHAIEQMKGLSQGEIERVVERLAKLLDDSDAEVRLQALLLLDSRSISSASLERVGIPARLQSIAQDASRSLYQRLALQILARQRFKDEKTLAMLSRLVEKTKAKTTLAWIHGASCSLQGEESASCEQLCRLAQDADWRVRNEAVRIQGTLAFTTRRCADALVKAMEDKTIIVRYNAAFALGRQSSLSPAAKERLKKGMSDLREPLLVISSAYALCAHEEAPACKEILSLLRHRDANIRLQASRSLTRPPQIGQKQRSSLQGLVVEPQMEIALVAAFTLCRLGECGLALPVLRKALDSQIAVHQVLAGLYIQKIGSAAAPALQEALTASSPPSPALLRLIQRMRWRAISLSPTLQALRKEAAPPLQAELDRTLAALLRTLSR